MSLITPCKRHPTGSGGRVSSVVIRNPLGFSGPRGPFTQRVTDRVFSVLAPFDHPISRPQGGTFWTAPFLKPKGVRAAAHRHGRIKALLQQACSPVWRGKTKCAGGCRPKPGQTPTSTVRSVDRAANPSRRNHVIVRWFRAHDFSSFHHFAEARRKCSPITSSGRLSSPRSVAMFNADVFVARIRRVSSTRSSSVKNRGAAAPCLRNTGLRSPDPTVPPRQRVPACRRNVIRASTSSGRKAALVTAL